MFVYRSIFLLFICRSVCGPVGVEDRNKIPDARMTASTFYDSSHVAPYYGRLNENRGYGVWCTKTTTDRTDYLQVDMGAVYSVCAVATQGSPGDSRTTSYKVHLSTDGVTWNSYKENNVEKVTNMIHACLEVAVFNKYHTVISVNRTNLWHQSHTSPVLLVYKGCTYRYILQRKK